MPKPQQGSGTTLFVEETPAVDDAGAVIVVEMTSGGETFRFAMTPNTAMRMIVQGERVMREHFDRRVSERVVAFPTAKSSKRRSAE